MPGGSRATTRTPATSGRVANNKPALRSAKTSSPAGSSPYTPVDLTEEPPGAFKKRKYAVEGPGYSTKKSSAEALLSPSKKTKQENKGPPEEKRCRRFRDKAPQSFHDVYDRAMNQRFYVLGRQRSGTQDCPGEKVELTGSTGNIYTVNIGRQPTCDCPHAGKGNQCKHIIFVMKKVLNAPYHLVYQLGLLSPELRDIFAAAPPIEPHTGATEDDGNGKRKPVEGDCPICFSDLEPGSGEAIVWCRAACGQNMHAECFQTWARTRGGSGDVTCPMCRSIWEGDGAKGGDVDRSKGRVSEGYVNVADQLGISGVRDTSSYSEWFGRPRSVGFGGGGYGGARRGWRGGYGGGRRGGWRRW